MSIPSVQAPYAEIRDELRSLSAKARCVPLSVAELSKASSLVGALVKKGLRPRALGLSLRQLGLNPRKTTRAKI